MDVSAYLDIKVVAAADAEFESVSAAMTALFKRVHQAIYQYGNSAVGISFPEFNRAAIDVGTRLRLHGNEVLLGKIENSFELKKTSLFAKNFGIKKVNLDDVYGYINVYRTRPTKRQIQYEEKMTTGVRLLLSSSTGQVIPFFPINQVKAEKNETGKFSNYGLSQVHTVPFFMT